MDIEKADLYWAASQGAIADDQVETLWATLETRMEMSDRPSSHDQRPRFTVANVAYYFGAMMVIGSMAWFMTLAWESFGGAGMAAIATLYAVLFVLAGRTLYFEQGLRIPGGLLFTMAVCMAPPIIYGVQRVTGFWLQDDPGRYRDFYHWIKGSWFLMELGTILAGFIALRFVRFPFLVAPIAFSLYFMSMDAAPLLYGGNDVPTRARAIVSLWFGLVFILIAYFIDINHRRTQGDFAYWFYLFGILAFWFSLPFLGDDTEFHRFLYCLTNVGLIALSLLLKRRLFTVFGAIGVFAYLSYLSYSVFADSILFPFILTVLGILIIFLGVQYQRHYAALERWMEEGLPYTVRRWLPRER